MGLRSLAVTAVRVPAELAFEVAKRAGGTAVGAARLVHGVVAGRDERVPEARAPSGNGGPPDVAEHAAPERDPWVTTGPPEPGTGEPQPVEESEVVEPQPVEEPEVVEPEPVEESEVVEPQPVEESVTPEPAHVSEEPEIVAEAAEAGAEEGAGAEVHVDEPWPGYDRMTAADITDRLVAEGSEVAAAVSLYEASRKGRRSVLEAAARGMRG
jgi:hypothetical protein